MVVNNRFFLSLQNNSHSQTKIKTIFKINISKEKITYQKSISSWIELKYFKSDIGLEYYTNAFYFLFYF